jgi:hypothetical protein
MAISEQSILKITIPDQGEMQFHALTPALIAEALTQAAVAADAEAASAFITHLIVNAAHDPTLSPAEVRALSDTAQALIAENLDIMQHFEAYLDETADETSYARLLLDAVQNRIDDLWEEHDIRMVEQVRRTRGETSTFDEVMTELGLDESDLTD